MALARIASRVSLAALIVLGCAGPSLAEPAIGQPAPAFRLTDLDGKPVAQVNLVFRPR